jgi:hypothetical protein
MFKPRIVLGTIRKDTRLAPIRTETGERLKIETSSMRAPFGAQSKGEARFALDLIVTDPATVRELEAVDEWVAKELRERRPDLLFIPCLKRREGQPPKLRTKFAIAGQMPLRCWTPERQPISFENMDFKASLLTPILVVRGVWSNNGQAGVLLEVRDVIASKNRAEWPFHCV